MKRGDIDFQCANNVVAVKWIDNRGVTMVGTCLQECNKISTVTCRVRGQSAKVPVPCPEIIKDSNSGISGVDLLDQKPAVYKLDRKSSGGRYYLWIIFCSDGYLCCKFACNLQSIVPKGNGITRFQNCSGQIVDWYV